VTEGAERKVTMMGSEQFRYTYNSLVYAGEEIAKSVERVARFGYDAIEVVGEPEQIDARQVAKLTHDAGIGVSSICSIYTAERDLVSPDASVRSAAVRYVKQLVDFAEEMSAPTVIVHPTACMKTKGLADPKTEWQWAVENIREAGDYAAGHGVNLSLEAWNRYETYFLNRLEQARALWTATGLTNGGVQGDLFHMNIEEASIVEAFRASAGMLQHVHFADSDRTAPGGALIDFEPVMDVLVEIGYDKYIGFELLPAAADPFAGGRHEEFFDRYTERAIKTIRAVEALVRTRRTLGGKGDR
jgi:sugar phosphate isomerase/epimerase